MEKNSNKIVPSIYTCDTTKIYDEIVKLKSVGINWIHFDIMDGHFVNNYGLGIKTLNDIKIHFPKIIIDTHIMANDLGNELLKNLSKSDYITFHLNSLQNDKTNILIKKIKKLNCKVGLALDLNNNIEEIKPYLNKIDLITIMSIKPGFTGQKFNNTVWPKLKEIISLCHKFYPHILIQIDGGVRWNNIKKLINYNVDLIVVGSLLFQEKDYSLVMKKIQEIKKAKLFITI